MGIRTSYEIDPERYALKALRGISLELREMCQGQARLQCWRLL
jgi:hypothetical protein